MLDWADYDPNGFTSSTTRHARKEHTCDECGLAIKPGQHYRLVSGKFDGRFWQAKACHRCVEVWRWLSDVCGGSLHHAMWEDIEEHVGETGDYRLMRISALHDTPQRWEACSPEDIRAEVDKSKYRIKALAALVPTEPSDESGGR